MQKFQNWTKNISGGDFFQFLVYSNIAKNGCGAVGRAVASDTRGPGFESSHRQLLLNIYLLLTVCWKDENKEKEAGNGPCLKTLPKNIECPLVVKLLAQETPRLFMKFVYCLSKTQIKTITRIWTEETQTQRFRDLKFFCTFTEFTKVCIPIIKFLYGFKTRR